jgi:alpha-tubulin suppressor-like RCC1 family protein
LSLGAAFTCAVSVSNVPYCWGANDLGNLGVGTKSTDRVLAPKKLDTDVPFSRITAGLWEGCGLGLTGLAYCWGPNYHGKVGDGTYSERLSPTRVQSDLKFQDVVITELGVCGLLVASAVAGSSAGELYCWGAGNVFGNGNNFAGSVTPRLAAGGQRFLSVAAGSGFLCGIGLDRRAYCWGSNSTGAIGQPILTLSPVAVIGPTFAVAL